MTTTHKVLNKRSLTRSVAVVGLGISIAFASSAKAAIQYSITNIAPDSFQTAGEKINNNGQVAGFISPTVNDDDALYYNGTALDLKAVLGNPKQSNALDINDSGLTIGQFSSGFPDYIEHTFLYSPSSNSVQDLSSLFPSGTTQNSGFGINNSGQVTGSFTNANVTRAFLYSGGVVQDLSAIFPGGTTYSIGYRINNSGHIAGGYADNASSNAFLYTSGAAQNLNTALGNTAFAQAFDLNNHDQVVGYFMNGVYEDANTPIHAFLYSNGSATDLNSALPSGTTFSSATGINDNGQVVGFFEPPRVGGLFDPPSYAQAFIYANGVAQDLNDLIDPNSGWVLTNAYAINNNGQITGTGHINGRYQGFILTPKNRKVSGSGSIGTGGKLSNFVFSASSTGNAPGASGSITFATKSGINIQNAPITSLTYSGNTATFSGFFSRGKGNNPGFFVVTIDSSAQTFSIALYVQGNPTPYFTQSGALTNGVVSTSGPTLI